MNAGARVRAVSQIRYLSGVVIPADRRGTVAAVMFGGAVVGIIWDGDSAMRATPPLRVEVLS